MPEGKSILEDMVASDGDPRDLTQQQIPLLKSVFEDETGSGLYLFTHYICGCHDIIPTLHGEICQFLSMWGKIELAGNIWEERPPTDGDPIVDSWRRLHLCIPRDHFKTSVATRANTLWRLVRNPELTFGIFHLKFG